MGKILIPIGLLLLVPATILVFSLLERWKGWDKFWKQVEKSNREQMKFWAEHPEMYQAEETRKAFENSEWP